VAKSAKSPSSQLKDGRSTAGTACPSTGNPGSNFIIFSFFRDLPVVFIYSGTLIENIMVALCKYADMAGSWKEARECAASEGLPQVYHNWDAETYGACRAGEQQGVFKAGMFIEHRCICMPASLSAEELETRERKFREDNPDW